MTITLDQAVLLLMSDANPSKPELPIGIVMDSDGLADAESGGEPLESLPDNKRKRDVRSDYEDEEAFGNDGDTLYPPPQSGILPRETLYVGNIPKYITRMLLIRIFCRFGRLQHLFMPRSTHHRKTYALINFVDPECIRTFLRDNPEIVIDGSPLEIKLSRRHNGPQKRKR